MATVPTGQMERELRKLYLAWVAGISQERDMDAYINQFQNRSSALIQRMGGEVARLGVYLADFPAPKLLELSPHMWTIYDDMKQAVIQASIAAGLNAKDAARAMFRAGMDKSFYRLTRLARTETVSAYWKNQWDSTEGLGLVMVWSSEDGPRTCAWCKDRDGLIVTDRTIRDHPNGRCTLAPMLPSGVAYRGTLMNAPQRQPIIWQDRQWRDRVPPVETSGAAALARAVAAPVPRSTPKTAPGASRTTPGAAGTTSKGGSTPYTATAPDGTTFTRTSVRDYQWANLYFTEGAWKVSQFTGSRASAENFADRLTRQHFKNVIVPLGRS